MALLHSKMIDIISIVLSSSKFFVNFLKNCTF